MLALGLDARIAVQQRQETGGAAPEAVHEMIDELNLMLVRFKTQAQTWQQQIDRAEAH